MEKARRIVERDAIVKRLAMLDERLIGIVQEQTELHATLNAVATDEPLIPTMTQNSVMFPIQY